LLIKTPRNLLRGYTAAVILDVKAYTVASTCAGVSLAKSTPGGIIINANISVPIAVDEQSTQTISGMCRYVRFHRNTKHMSKKLANIVSAKAPPIIILGSVCLNHLS